MTSVQDIVRPFRSALSVGLVAALLGACTGDGEAPVADESSSTTSPAPPTTVPEGLEVPADRVLEQGEIYAYPWVPWARVLSDLNGQNWKLAQVYVESPVPVHWVDDGVLQARIRLADEDHLELLSEAGVVASFRPTRDEGVGSDIVLDGRRIRSNHPWMTNVGKDCPTERPEADDLLGIYRTLLSSLDSAEGFVLLDEPSQWVVGGPAQHFYGTTVGIVEPTEISGGLPTDVAYSADPRVARAVAERLHDGHRVMVALDELGPVLLAASLGENTFEPLVGCGVYNSFVESVDEWYDHDRNGNIGRGDPPVAEVDPVTALLALTGFEPIDGMTVAAMRTWEDTQATELSWEERDPRYRFASADAVPPAIWANVAPVTVSVQLPEGFPMKPDSSERPTLCLWTSLGWSGECTAAAGADLRMHLTWYFSPGDPVEVSFLGTDGFMTDDPIVLATFEDVKPNAWLRLEITGNPTLADLRTDAARYVRITCCPVPTDGE